MGELIALPTAAAFQKWMKPGEALTRLRADWPIRTKQQAIMARIADGSIIAVARSGILQRRGRGVQRFETTTIDPKLWRAPFVARDHAFWLTGDVSFDDTPPMQMFYVISMDDQPLDEDPTLIANFKDVRLDPVSFAAEFAGYLPSDPEEGPEDEPQGKPLAAAEMERFARLYLDLWGEAATEMKALAAARATYPDNRIGRDVFLVKFREVRGPGKRGKPTFRGK